MPAASHCTSVAWLTRLECGRGSGSATHRAQTVQKSIEERLVNTKGVISFTFDVQASRAVVRVRNDLTVEVWCASSRLCDQSILAFVVLKRNRFHFHHRHWWPSCQTSRLCRHSMLRPKRLSHRACLCSLRRTLRRIPLWCVAGALLLCLLSHRRRSQCIWTTKRTASLRPQTKPSPLRATKPALAAGSRLWAVCLRVARSSSSLIATQATLRALSTGSRAFAIVDTAGLCVALCSIDAMRMCPYGLWA